MDKLIYIFAKPRPKHSLAWRKEGCIITSDKKTDTAKLGSTKMKLV